ncbi:MAG: transposase [Acidimicrobiia bacterium]|nr:transposase [Acidimicrobiia bacterium]
MTIVGNPDVVIGGVDTHADVHVAAVVDHVGGVLGVEAFATTRVGYRQLVSWLRSFGELVLVGVEGTGSYGAGLSRYLRTTGIDVVEVDRPNRQVRHRQGKSDPVDAVAAARAALSGQATVTPKSRDGTRPQARSSARPYAGSSTSPDLRCRALRFRASNASHGLRLMRETVDLVRS